MEHDVKIVHFIGWHGADENDLDSIQKNNFRESTGDHHWIGDGVYFFTERIGDPIAHAENWAKSEAYKKKYRRFVVIKASISVNDDAILDLNDTVGLELFNQHRSYVLSALSSKGKSFRTVDVKYSDSKVIEHLKQRAGIEVVIRDFYVQFGEDRKKNISSRVPNCTFLCVSNPDENIDPDTIKVARRGNT
ncbi:MAG: hypothetical protein WCR52_00090 [Bacteroidota bacterium]|uniref:hypothetical protein n=1 Tax=Runella sp. TaxID=1960881 RepID=UPI003015B0B7